MDPKLAQEWSRRYLLETIKDADYGDCRALLANTPAQPEKLRPRVEWAASGIGLYVNANKTEYMYFNQRGDISTLNVISWKLVDNFPYLLINWDRHQYATSKGMESYR